MLRRSAARRFNWVPGSDGGEKGFESMMQQRSVMRLRMENTKYWLRDWFTRLTRRGRRSKTLDMEEAIRKAQVRYLPPHFGKAMHGVTAAVVIPPTVLLYTGVLTPMNIAYCVGIVDADTRRGYYETPEVLHWTIAFVGQTIVWVYGFYLSGFLRTRINYHMLLPLYRRRGWVTRTDLASATGTQEVKVKSSKVFKKADKAWKAR